MARKISMLGGILAVLVGIAVYLLFFGKTISHSENPLVKVDLEKVNRVVLQTLPGTIELEKTPTGWEMKNPVRDAIEPNFVPDVLTALRSFSIGAPISENASKHAQFQVDKAQGIHVQVFIEAKTDPVLDGYVGKPAAGYGASYFRFEASTPVYVANDLPNYQFRRDPKSVRLKKVLPPVPQATAVKIVTEKFTVDLVRSSQTWTHRGDTKTFDAILVQPLLTKLDSLNVTDFGSGSETADVLGFAKPYLQVSVDVSSRTASFVVGKKSPELFPKAPVMRYAKSDGRDAVLILRDDAITEILNSLKTIPK